jgi:hypothetical protein
MASVAATINEIVDAAMATGKGVNVNLSWERECKVKKSCGDTITKRTETVGRVGIDYNNRAVVQQMRESGDLPSEEQPIWYGKGAWVIFPYLIQHTVTKQLYLRLYQGTDPNYRPTVQYFRNGVPVTREDVEADLLASEKRSDTRLCFCVKIEDMLNIGKLTETVAEPVAA